MWALVILIFICCLFFTSIVFNIWMYLRMNELKHELDLQNNSIKSWLDEEVDMKRTYKKLSDSLTDERNRLRNELSNLRKKYNKLNKLMKSYITWRIDISILKSKYK